MRLHGGSTLPGRDLSDILACTTWTNTGEQSELIRKWGTTQKRSTSTSQKIQTSNEQQQTRVQRAHLINTSESTLSPPLICTIWLLSLLLTAFNKASSFSPLSPSSSPKLTMSKATLFFFSFLPMPSSKFFSARTGLQKYISLRSAPSNKAEQNIQKNQDIEHSLMRTLL